MQFVSLISSSAHSQPRLNRHTLSMHSEQADLSTQTNSAVAHQYIHRSGPDTAPGPTGIEVVLAIGAYAVLSLVVTKLVRLLTRRWKKNAVTMVTVAVVKAILFTPSAILTTGGAIPAPLLLVFIYLAAIDITDSRMDLLVLLIPFIVGVAIFYLLELRQGKREELAVVKRK